MTDEEIKALQETNEKLTKELEALKQHTAGQQTLPNILPPPAANPPSPSLEEQAKANAEEKAKIEAASKKIEETLKFNMDIKRFVEENAAIVGEEIQSIISLSENVKYATALEKANELRSNILSSFFKRQEHIEALVIDKYKAKAAEFLELAAVVKNQRSAEFWDLFELAVENIKLKEKQEELLKKTNGQATDKKTNEHNKKFFDARSYYIPAKAA
ncbi:MAG: hypothetical protein LBH29_03090 [Elusimicrobiota bacterium]|jgi:hypothetical protein|nr:hypothetical protein [Elusimicrobiota bacterium]